MSSWASALQLDCLVLPCMCVSKQAVGAIQSLSAAGLRHLCGRLPLCLRKRGGQPYREAVIDVAQLCIIIFIILHQSYLPYCLFLVQLQTVVGFIIDQLQRYFLLLGPTKKSQFSPF